MLATAATAALLFAFAPIGAQPGESPPDLASGSQLPQSGLWIPPHQSLGWPVTIFWTGPQADALAAGPQTRAHDPRRLRLKLRDFHGGGALLVPRQIASGEMWIDPSREGGLSAEDASPGPLTARQGVRLAFLPDEGLARFYHIQERFLLSLCLLPAQVDAVSGEVAPVGETTPLSKIEHCRDLAAPARGEAVALGNPRAAWLYTLLALAGLAGLGAALLRGRSADVLRGASGRLSLARVQMALWSLAVGVLVFRFGLLSEDTPEIPASLLALMGLSGLTAGLGSLGRGRLPGFLRRGSSESAGSHASTVARVDASSVDASSVDASSVDAAAVDASQAPKGLHLADLLLDEKGAPSISRAQMLLWTFLVLGLFLIQSLGAGRLWEVPWELAALMGISQAGYLVPRHYPQGGAGSRRDIATTSQNPDASTSDNVPSPGAPSPERPDDGPYSSETPNLPARNT